VPNAFTPTGRAKTSEEVLEKVDLPPVKALLEFAMLEKRMGQIADGREGWLKHVTNIGRIHGRVDSNSCVSGRMSHSKPNLGQVPSLTKRDGTVQPYGRECRRLFLASPGYKLVGIDADALELVCLAGYMSPWDGGAYIRAQTTGCKEDGTDPHSLNAAALGGVPRDMAKQWFYAMLYGAGNPALGVYLGAVGKVQKLARIGKDKRELFMRNMPALKRLVDTIHKRVEGAGYLKALDGRRLFIRAKHAAINQLLQSAGAILMKRALIILDADLQARGLVPGEDYEFVLNVHDEWQIEALPARAELVGERGVAAITAAGEYYKFPCPVSGSYKIGDSWDETH
jgi:DNA polymerase I-like protein with 3'-5' exonuclease and polymerase domains